MSAYNKILEKYKGDDEKIQEELDKLEEAQSFRYEANREDYELWKRAPRSIRGGDGWRW